jgi:hypothetical protein
MQRFVREFIAKSLQHLESRLDDESFDRGMKEIEEGGTISLEETTGLMPIYIFPVANREY